MKPAVNFNDTFACWDRPVAKQFTRCRSPTANSSVKQVCWWDRPFLTVGRRSSDETVQGPPTVMSLVAPTLSKWNGNSRLECVDGRHPPSRTPVAVLPWTCRSEAKWPSSWTGGQSKSNPHKWLASRKVWSAEELETLPAVTEPRTSHYRSSGGERCGKQRGSARRSSLKGRERAIVSQTNIGTVRKTTLGNVWETGWRA